MRLVRGLLIALDSSSVVPFAVGAGVTFQELVAEMLKVAVMMGREELTGLPKAD